MSAARERSMEQKVAGELDSFLSSQVRVHGYVRHILSPASLPFTHLELQQQLRWTVRLSPDITPAHLPLTQGSPEKKQRGRHLLEKLLANCSHLERRF